LATVWVSTIWQYINDARIVAKLGYNINQAIKQAVLAAEVEFNDDLVNYLCRKKL